MNELYELFILGELMDQNKHGYLLFTILNKVIGPIRTISWGVLYPLIHRLEKERLIEPASMGEKEGGHKKKSYQITGRGRKQFLQLMNEPIPYKAEYELHVWIKFSNFDQIDRSLQMTIIRQYQEFLERNESFIRQNYESVHGNPGIPQQEIEHVESLIDLRLREIETKKTWLDESLTRIMESEANH